MSATVTDPDGNELHGIKAITEQARKRRAAVKDRVDKAKDLKGTTRDILTDWASRDLTIKRTAPQWSPWAISGALFTIAAANEIATRLGADPAAAGAYTLGSTVALLGGVIAAMRARHRLVNRLIPQNPTQARWMALCAGVAMAWLAIAVVVGITPTSGPVLGVVLMASTLALARLHWRHHREPDPASVAPQLPPASLGELAASTAPPAREEEDTEQGPRVPEQAQYYLDQWENVVSKSARLMPGTVLEYEGEVVSEGEDNQDKVIGYRFRLHLPEDGVTFSGVLNGLGGIENALHTPQKNLSVERIPEEVCKDPAQIWFEVITHSPIDELVPMLSTRYRCERDENGHVSRGWVDLGPYANGDGSAEWTVYSGGESMWSGLVIGGTGSGKTVVLDTLALSLASNDHTVLWYADGQGSSSNFIPTIADYTATQSDEWEDMLSSLEMIAAARAEELRAAGVKDPTRRGLRPSPEHPGIAVIVDECQILLANHKTAERWEKLSKIVRKVNMCLILATQSAEQKSFGHNTGLREQLIQGNSIVLRTTGNSQAHFVGLDMDPKTLPKIPGFGYLVTKERISPFRSVFHNNYTKLWHLLGYGKTPLDEVAVGAASIATEGRYNEKSQIAPEDVLDQVEGKLQQFRDAARGHLDLVQAHKDANPDPEQDLVEDVNEIVENTERDTDEIAQMLADLQAETEAQADIDRIAETVSVLGSGQKAALDAIARVKLDAQDRAEQYKEEEGPVAVSATDLAQERDISRQRAATLISALVERELITDTGQGYELTVPALAYMERYGRELAPA